TRARTGRTTASWRPADHARALLAVRRGGRAGPRVLHRAGGAAPRSRLGARLRTNSLTLFFGVIFLAALVGQAVSGVAFFNREQLSAGLDPITLADYVTSSAFAV